MRHRGTEMRFLVHLVLTLWVSWARGQDTTCDPPRAANTHYIPESTRYSLGQEITYYCKKGFYPSSRENTTKCTDAGWDPPPRCSQITCDPPRAANTHYIPESTRYSLGQEITYYCKSGFYPSSRGNTAKCTDAGWDPPPRCSVNPCELPEIKHGTLYQKESYLSYFPAPLEQWFYYSCDENYVPPSQSSWGYVTCTQEGWSPAVPCLRKCVLSDLDLQHSLLKKTTYLEGVSVLVDCQPGYSLPNKQRLVTCTENGWSSPPRCLKHCDMPAFENARAIITGKVYRPNDTLDYQCLDGYENSDGSTAGSMLCGEDGWSQLPTCFKSTKKCGPPPAINNGDITSFPLEMYLPGSRVEYQCEAYYELRGPTYVTCSYGKWSQPPICIDPCVISEGTMNDNNIELKGKKDKIYYAKTGDTIEFTCKAGHSAVTSVESFEAICLEGRLEFPRCE